MKTKSKTVYKGNSEQDKAAVIQDLIVRLTELERLFEASEKSWVDVFKELEKTRAELVEVREHIEFLDEHRGRLLERSKELLMQVRELEHSLAVEKAWNGILRNHNPASGLTEPDIRLLLQLYHPDKHNGSTASEKATQLLLRLREVRP